jgi:hypothetical protein
MSDDDFSLLDGMAKQSKASRSDVLCEALRLKQVFDERERVSVLTGLESAKNEPLLSDDEANAHFEKFKQSMQAG